MCPAHFCQVHSRHGAETHGQRLQDYGKDVGQEDNEQKLEALRGAGSDVGGVIARVDV